MSAHPSDPVSTLVGDPVATIGPTATLRAAVTALAADAIGLLVVVDPRGVRGVFSERDIVTAIVDEADLDDTRVRDYATSEVISVELTDDIATAARAMQEHQVRHLAVADRGVITNVISIRDVLAVLLAHCQDGAV